MDPRKTREPVTGHPDADYESDTSTATAPPAPPPAPPTDPLTVAFTTLARAICRVALSPEHRGSLDYCRQAWYLRELMIYTQHDLDIVFCDAPLRHAADRHLEMTAPATTTEATTQTADLPTRSYAEAATSTQAAPLTRDSGTEAHQPASRSDEKAATSTKTPSQTTRRKGTPDLRRWEQGPALRKDNPPQLNWGRCGPLS